MRRTCRLRRISGFLPIAAWIALTGCERAETPAPQPSVPKATSSPKSTRDSNPTPGSAPAGAGPAAQGDKKMTSLTITSSAFAHNATIPRKYTGDGQDISPPLSWSGLPEGTKELALIVDDPDAPTPQPWVHWVAYHIPPDTSALPEGVAPSLRGPGSILQGKNSWPKVGYGGPSPPRGHGLHHYHFRLYALDAPLGLEPGLTKDAVLKAMKGHVLAEGVLTGTYQR
jgi:Raf kinase inhibitor-like YbhB/YbcL family protein